MELAEFNSNEYTESVPWLLYQRTCKVHQHRNSQLKHNTKIRIALKSLRSHNIHMAY